MVQRDEIAVMVQTTLAVCNARLVDNLSINKNERLGIHLDNQAIGISRDDLLLQHKANAEKAQEIHLHCVHTEILGVAQSGRADLCTCKYVGSATLSIGLRGNYRSSRCH
jgi:hypothetical protein